MNGHCNNCNHSVEVNIPKGTKVSEHEGIVECGYCGVKGDIRVDRTRLEIIERKYPGTVMPNPFWPQTLPPQIVPYRGSGASSTCNVNTPENLRDISSIHSSDRTPEEQARLTEAYYNK